jgi:co-chaperonin GroES (HSP10)
VRLEPELTPSVLARVGSRRVRTGIVVAVGPGRRTAQGARAAPDVAVGERVAFFREHMDTQQGRALAARLTFIQADLVLLRAADLLFVLDERMEVDA